ncbi:hypothetical protein NM688_g1469 [Phlebia brevispora]|uniref:Uncharacterized protein n=1 Tax=Phlebia brevispora TaxID=194682 RepID=A0ACC1TB36_9APHY|nr:hypothetical protein NM688_g1469 [Phlebia brevispora]
MPASTGLFKGLSASRMGSALEASAPTTADSAHVLKDVPMVVSRQGTHATDPDSRDIHNIAPRKWSQEDQDKVDAQTKKKITKELVSTWMDRLQLISVITTFFAAIEAQLIGVVTPSGASVNDVSAIGKAAAVTLACSLVVHVFAAILSFIAAFFLVRFRLNEATSEELKIEHAPSPKASEYDLPRIFTSNPNLELVGPFRRGHPPTHLLERCHGIAMFLALVGFLMALLGVMCFVWASLPSSASVASTICVALCIVACIVAIFAKAEEPTLTAKSFC